MVLMVYNGYQSYEFMVTSVVLQGSNPGSLLFIHFINDLLVSLTRNVPFLKMLEFSSILRYHIYNQHVDNIYFGASKILHLIIRTSRYFNNIDVCKILYFSFEE